MALDTPTARRVEKAYRKLRSVDMEALRRDLTTLPVFISPATNVTNLLAQYQNDLDGLLEIHAPLKRRVVTLRPSTPWYNEIASAKREGRKLERHWRKTKLTVHQQLYKHKCKQVRSLITSAKMEFYPDLIKENKGNYKVLFSAIDRMLNLTPEKCYPSCESAKEIT